MFSKAQKQGKKENKAAETLCLRCRRRNAVSSPAMGVVSLSARDELQSMAVSLWWRSCHEPLKKPRALKLKSSQLNSTEPDPVAEVRCAARETQINTCWELVFYWDNLWLWMPASKNTPPQGARQSRDIPASLEIWEQREEKAEEIENQQPGRQGGSTQCSDVLYCQVLQLKVSRRTRGNIYVKAKNVSSIASNEALKTSWKKRGEQWNRMILIVIILNSGN